MKILVFTKNWLGDAVFETPAITAINRNFPDSKIYCVTSPRCREILEKNPRISGVFCFDEKSTHRSWAERWSFVRFIREQKFDRVYIFHRSFSRALGMRLAGIPERIGYAGKGRDWLLTRAVKPHAGIKHQVHYFLYLLQAAGSQIDFDPYCEFYHSASDKDFAGKMLAAQGLAGKNLIALNPGGNRANKRWPTKYFAALADGISEARGMDFVITGSQEDESLAARIAAAVKRARIFSFCGKTSLGQLGALFSYCKLAVSGDSGPLHIAAGTGINVVGLFGPTDPEVYGPMGQGRNIIIQSESKTDKAMEEISPERVLQVIEKEKLL